MRTNYLHQNNTVFIIVFILITAPPQNPKLYLSSTQNSLCVCLNTLGACSNLKSSAATSPTSETFNITILNESSRIVYTNKATNNTCSSVSVNPNSNYTVKVFAENCAGPSNVTGSTICTRKLFMPKMFVIAVNMLHIQWLHLLKSINPLFGKTT